jgi:hypothetical protein
MGSLSFTVTASYPSRWALWVFIFLVGNFSEAEGSHWPLTYLYNLEGRGVSVPGKTHNQVDTDTSGSTLPISTLLDNLEIFWVPLRRSI